MEENVHEGREENERVEDAADGGGDGVGDDEEAEDNRQIVFWEKTLSTGRITHHFAVDRNTVKLNGRSSFACHYPGCKARLSATYSSRANKNLEEPMLDHSTIPSSDALPTQLMELYTQSRY